MKSNHEISIKELISIGFTQKEAEIYYAGIFLHTFSVTQISKKSGISRSTCYLILEQLIKKGFVSPVPDKNNSRFIIHEPQIILEKEKMRLKKTEKLVENLKKLRNKKTSRPFIQYFRGVDGVQQIYRMILQENPVEVYSLVNPDFLVEYVGVDFINNWLNNRIQKGIKIIAFQHKKYDKKNNFSSNKQHLREVHILKEDQLNFHSMLHIFNDKVAFVSEKQESFSFIVHSEEFSNVIKSLLLVNKK